MSSSAEHVVVLGASMGGLLAARALSERFAQVTIVERDRLEKRAVSRKGVPQGQHAHGLLAAGFAELTQHFPGLETELMARGAQAGHLGDGLWVLGGRVLRQHGGGPRGVTCDRPLLEHTIRERVLSLPNVQLLSGCDALALIYERERVRGVRVLRRDDGSAEERLEADLVVDATGRGSQLPQLLRELGYPAPREERVKVGVSYCTGIFRRKASHLEGRNVLVIAAQPPNPRCGVALAIDDEHWIVTLIGYLGEKPEPTYQGMVEYAKGLPAPALHALLSDTSLEGSVRTATFPYSQRRHYEELDAHPEGVLAFGDALCSFNPIFGQGMTVAALEAQALKRACTPGLQATWKRFYRASRPIIDVPWSMAVGSDLRFPEVEGARSVGGRMLNWYLEHLLAAGAADASVGEQFVRVTHMIDPPSRLMSPGIIARVLAQRLLRPSVRLSAGASSALPQRG